MASAQNYDSTGPARLWAPNPIQPGEGLNKVQVPGYGEYFDGAFVKELSAYYNDGQCGHLTEIGVCVAKRGASGHLKKSFIGSGPPQFDSWTPFPPGPPCPMNTEGHALFANGGHGQCN